MRRKPGRADIRMFTRSTAFLFALFTVAPGTGARGEGIHSRAQCFSYRFLHGAGERVLPRRGAGRRAYSDVRARCDPRAHRRRCRRQHRRRICHHSHCPRGVPLHFLFTAFARPIHWMYSKTAISDVGGLQRQKTRDRRHGRRARISGSRTVQTQWDGCHARCLAAGDGSSIHPLRGSLERRHRC